MRLKITGGRIFDPATGRQGEVGDLYLQGERIVSHLEQVDRVLDARGGVVCPGGIDLRGQVATFGLDFLRLAGKTPSLADLGAAYARLGYTHVHEPFLTLTTAGYVQGQLAALPTVDTSASLVLNLRDLDLWLSAPEHFPEIRQTILFFMEQTQALTLRVVEPFVRYRQDFYAHRTIGPEKTLEILTELALGQDFPLALEASPEVLRLSLPEPRAWHLAALGPALVADDLVASARAHLEQGATADLGLMASDAAPAPPFKVDLGWFRPLDLCPPGDAAANRRALQLAREYAGPNLAFSGAGAALAPLAQYPRFFSRLRDEEGRRAWGEATPDAGRFSISRWVAATRTLPARVLGLPDRGHFGPGARADVAIYDISPDVPPAQWAKGLARCRFLLKAGEMVVEEFELVRPDIPKATCYRMTGAAATAMAREISEYSSFRWENLGAPEGLGGPWMGLG